MEELLTKKIIKTFNGEYEVMRIEHDCVNLRKGKGVRRYTFEEVYKMMAEDKKVNELMDYLIDFPPKV